MRHEASFLKDILAAAKKVESITAAANEESFAANEILPAAVLHRITVIGKAVGRLSPEF